MAGLGCSVLSSGVGGCRGVQGVYVCSVCSWYAVCCIILHNCCGVWFTLRVCVLKAVELAVYCYLLLLLVVVVSHTTPVHVW